MQHLDEGVIHAWLDGQLPRDEAAAAEAHVAECRQCADTVAEARGLIAASSRILMSLDNVPRDVAPKQGVSAAPAVPAAPPPAVAASPATTAAAAPNAVIDLPSRAAAGPRAGQRAPRRWLSAPALAAAATIVAAVGTFALSRADRRSMDSELPNAARLESRPGPSAADSSIPVVANVPVPAPPAVPAPASLGVDGRANEVRESAAPANARALRAGAAAAADQSVARDRQPARVDGFARKVAGAVAATPSSAAPRDEGKRAARDTERAALADQAPRLLKERAPVGADSLGKQRQVAAVTDAASPPPRAQSRADTSTITATRRADADRPSADRREARAEAAAPATTGTIRGRVTDGNNTGVAGALVAVAGTSTGVTTSETGAFALAGVQPGNHRLAVRRIGYDSVSRDLAIGAGQTTTVDVVLRPTRTMLSEVQTAGTTSVRVFRSAPKAAASPVAPAAPGEAAPGAAVTAAQSNAVGCYEMGITPTSQQTRTGFRQTPRRVALDAAIVPSNADGVWYLARDLARTGAVPNGLWRPVDADGLELEWTYGSRVARVRLTGAAGRMMRGTVEEIDRASGTGESGTVVSVRTSCGG